MASTIFFTYPYWAFNFTLSGYPLTFLTMLCVSLITCTMTTKLKQQERIRAESEKEKMRANLLRSVSHDIRTPLTSIVGVTSTLLETPNLPIAEQRQLLEDARDEAQWLIRVVEKPALHHPHRGRARPDYQTAGGRGGNPRRGRAENSASGFPMFPSALPRRAISCLSPWTLS